MNSIEEIRAVVEEKLRTMGLELCDVKYHAAGRHSLLRVSIDKPDGVTVDDCERASRELSVLLDVEGFSDNPYSLEVSSPGLDRPLHSERDFRRAIGRDVAIEVIEPVAERKGLTGRVVSCEDATLVLQTEGGPVAVRIENVKSGKVEVRFK